VLKANKGKKNKKNILQKTQRPHGQQLMRILHFAFCILHFMIRSRGKMAVVFTRAEWSEGLMANGSGGSTLPGGRGTLNLREQIR
jgi:hypothetical protein